MIMEKRVLQYMATRGSITSKEAIDYLGCTRLSEYIRRIKKHTDIESERIIVENRWGDHTSVSKYWIKEKE